MNSCNHRIGDGHTVRYLFKLRLDERRTDNERYRCSLAVICELADNQGHRIVFGPPLPRLREKHFVDHDCEVLLRRLEPRGGDAALNDPAGRNFYRALDLAWPPLDVAPYPGPTTFNVLLTIGSTICHVAP